MPVLACYTPDTVPADRHPDPDVKRVKIIAKLEMSVHDGYCSGAEGDYQQSIVTYILDWIPWKPLQEPPNPDWDDDDDVAKYNKLYDDYLDKLDNDNDKRISVSDVDFDYWIQVLPKVNTDRDRCCSYYCGTSAASVAHGLLSHQYRYTIRKVTYI